MSRTGGAVPVAAALLALVAAGPAAAEDDPIAALLEGERPALHRCWEKAAADDFRLAGEVVLQLSLGREGAVRRVKVARDTAGDRVLRDCLVARARGWRLAGLEADTVEIPLAFRAPGAQYTVRLEDVPAGPRAKGDRSIVRALVDRRSMAAEKASLAHVEAGGRSSARLAHAGVALLYVLDGRLTVQGGGTADAGVVLEQGDAAYVPPATPVRIIAAGRRGEPVRYLRLLVPPPVTGAPAGTAAAAAGRTVVIGGHAGSTEHSIAGGKGSVRILVDREVTGDGAAYAGTFRGAPGMKVPEHAHATEAEILHVLAGRATLTVKGETFPVEAGMALHLPPGVPHALEVTSSMEAAQFYVPGGPEQRFKGKR